MKKKLLLFIAMLSLFVFVLAFSASAVEVDGIYYTVSGSGDNAYAEVSAENRANCKLENVVIPDTITVNGTTYKVTTIASSAWGNNYSSYTDNTKTNQFIKTLTIGANVNSIGSHAFRCLPYLETVVFDNHSATSAISMSNAEFMYNDLLTSVTFTENSKVSQIGGNCFAYCDSLETLSLLSSSLTSLGSNSLKNCKALTTLDFSKTSLTTLRGIWDTTSLTKIILPSTLKTIYGNGIQNTALKTLVLPHGIESLAKDALANNYSLYMLIMPKVSNDAAGFNTAPFNGAFPEVVIYAGENYTAITETGKIFAGYTVKHISEYDPTKTYTGKNLFYGATTCSNCNGLLGDTEFIFTDPTTNLREQRLCTHCGEGDVTNYAPIFKDLGYSFSLYSNSVLHNVAICHKSLQLYNEKFPDEQISAYGILTVLKSNVDETGVAFTDNGTAKDKVKHVDFSTKTVSYDIITMKVNGLNPELTTDQGVSYGDLEIYICGFIKVGDKTYYINDTSSEKLFGEITYNSLVEADK